MQIKDLKPGATITIPGYILVSTYGSIIHCGAVLPGYTTVIKHDITFTVPDNFNAVTDAIQTIDRQIEMTEKTFKEAMDNLNAKKADLLQANNGESNG